MSAAPDAGGRARRAAPDPAERARAAERERRVVVFACGEMARGDDAAALLAAGRLAERGDERLDVRVVGALEPEHLADLGGRPCVVADCVVGVEPGEIVVRQLTDLLPRSGERVDGRAGADGGETVGGRASPDGGAASDGRGAVPAARSTHLLPLGDVLALVELLEGGLPPGIFVGVGGADFGLGRPPSAEVERALPTFVAAIEAASEELLAAVD